MDNHSLDIFSYIKEIEMKTDRVTSSNVPGQEKQFPPQDNPPKEKLRPDPDTPPEEREGDEEKNEPDNDETTE